MSQQELQFTPVEVGNMSEIPPDAPDGEYVASLKATLRASSKGDPMFVLEYKLEESLTEGNESFQLPARVTKFLVIRGADHQYVKMYRQDLAAICAGHGIPVPKFTRIAGADDVAEFINDLTANRVVVRTKNVKDKTTGEVRTNIVYPKKVAEDFVSADDAPRFGGGKKKHRG